MPTVDNLVPNGQPYGEKQKTKAAMQRANLPLQQTSQSQGPSVPPGGSAPQAASPVSAGPLGLLLNNNPEAFPFLNDASPTNTQNVSEPVAYTAALAASGQSSFARAVSARLSQITRG